MTSKVRALPLMVLIKACGCVDDPPVEAGTMMVSGAGASMNSRRSMGGVDPPAPEHTTCQEGFLTGSKAMLTTNWPLSFTLPVRLARLGGAVRVVTQVTPAPRPGGTTCQCANQVTSPWPT